MNFSQITEGAVSKNVFECERKIREDPSKSPEIIKWLNDNIIKEFNYDEYFNQVSDFQKKIESDEELREKFNKHVIDNNLFIEGPNFSEVNIKNLLKNSRIPINEEVVIKKECLQYLKQKMKMEHLPVPVQDVTLKNIFVAPIYTLRLNKLASSIITARGLGPCKFVTGQPLRGKASGGGSRVGYTAHYKSSEFGRRLDQIIPIQVHTKMWKGVTTIPQGSTQ
ncbi:MAG: hypothetical protein K9H48_07770 [Melioribacteraceae bacterium]|nr:hypothetical protein [Melioribacteraceae bacterium]